ncbi:amino acid adenylation domain-containing protein [Motilimonas cestriensis]|uniref:Amino acid adenylation domain-containing protein n=1 Tax=Motilimonas cestriensis TaxID=2742685 RepID=A0ABS8WHA6_9GAMM|nr:non-ribosomal peptide synthetase [Motilimonas cestriensis]MCE2597004.1 amino acid adenylation domain-containing protein [Motilimonas cestriensis]
MKQLNTAQQGLWLGHTLNQNKALFNTAECIVFQSEIQTPWLARAIQQTVQEIACLSCHFVSDDANVPYMQPATLPAQLPTVRLDEVDEVAEASLVSAWAEKDIEIPFDLSKELPCRFTLLEGQTKQYLYTCVHHIALDGFGTSLMFQRIAEIYSALVNDKAITPSPFGQFDAVLAEDQQRKESGAYQKARDFWLSLLTAQSPASSYAEKVMPISARFHRQSGHIDGATWQRVQHLAQMNKVTWVDVLLAAISVHLRCYTGDKQVVIGMMVMNRMGSKSLTVPCMQMNIVPLVVDIEDQDQLMDVASKIASHKKKMRRFQHYRYEDLRRDINRVGGEQRLFGTLVNIMPFDHPLKYGDVTAQTLNLSAGPVEDLTIEIHSQNEGAPLLDIDANPSVYQAQQVASIKQEYLDLLERWSGAPEETVVTLLNSCFARERAQAIIAGAPLNEPRITGCALTQIRHWAEYTPERIAIRYQDQVLSYGELWQQTQQAAAALNQQGVRAGDRVGVALQRSPKQIISTLGVLLSGAVYVPLDPEQPLSRQQSIVLQGTINTLITQAEYQHQLAPLAVAKVLLAGSLSAEPCFEYASTAQDSAYVMFTSGSTGQPKGVNISHGALAHFVASARQAYQVGCDDRVLQFAPFNFDASIEEVFVTLTAGAELVLRTDAMLESMNEFVAFIEAQQITLLDLPTAFWNEWVVSLDSGMVKLPHCLTGVIIGGEAVYPEQLAKWQRAVARDVLPLNQSIRLLNTYGPTEATVVATYCDIQHVATNVSQLPIGQPLPGVAALILGKGDKPAHSGELVLLGPTLAQGYVGLQHDAFTELLIGDQWRRVYRTGDRVSCDADSSNNIVYLGRIDNEFKISGYRINPGEIESHLLAQSKVLEACVQGIVYDSGIRRLVAFVASNEADLSAKDIKGELSQVLPAAMVPTDYRVMSSLPKTSSNKVDRKALLALYHQDTEFTELATETQTRVCAIWQQILGVSGIQGQDNFFELGGQSLQTIQIVNRLAAEFGLSVKVSDVFDRPILSEFCHFLEQLQTQGEDEVEMVW